MAGDKGRLEREARGKAVAALEPEAMRAYLLEHPLSRGGRLWCDRIIEGVDKDQRNALRLYAQAMRWVGAETNIAIQFVQALGVRDEDELRSLVESGRKLERLKADAASSLEEYREAGLDLLRLVVRERPTWKEEILARLEAVSVAEVIAPTVAESENGETP